MAAVSKRVWRTARGDVRTAWVCTYVDANGHQHRRQFKLKRDADSERVRVEGELAVGVHVPDGRSITVDDATRAFLADFEELAEAGKRERSTTAGCEQHGDSPRIA